MDKRKEKEVDRQISMQTTSLNAADISKAFGRARFSPEFVKYHQLGHFLPQTSRWFLFVTRRKSLKDLPLPLPRGLFCRLLSPGGGKRGDGREWWLQSTTLSNTTNMKLQTKKQNKISKLSLVIWKRRRRQRKGLRTNYFTGKKADQRIMRFIIWNTK